MYTTEHVQLLLLPTIKKLTQRITVHSQVIHIHTAVVFGVGAHAMVLVHITGKIAIFCVLLL